jgi:Zn-dependent protease
VPNIKIDFGFCLFFACAVLLIPLRLVAAWMIAVSVHELAHYVALRLCNADIEGVRLTARGIVMKTGYIDSHCEFLCSLAGPFGSLLLLLLRRWMPCAAICGFIQACVNLLPIPSLDGGRALRSLILIISNIKENLANRQNK